MIVGLSGFAGVGKDTVADILVKNHGFVKIGLADELKRVCRQVFDFSIEQLWGPSMMREVPDRRYPREHTWGPNPKDGVYTCLCCGTGCLRGDQPAIEKCYLTPRYALQKLGTEWGRDCYTTIWTEIATRKAKGVMLEHREYSAHNDVSPPRLLLSSKPAAGVVIPDVRFLSEFSVLREFDKVEAENVTDKVEDWHTAKDWRGAAVSLRERLDMNEQEYDAYVARGRHRLSCRLVRLRRPGFDKPRHQHPSETEQAKIKDWEFDYIFEGQTTDPSSEAVFDIQILENKVVEMLDSLNAT